MMPADPQKMPPALSPLLTPIQAIEGVSPGVARLLPKLGIRRAADLLFQFPRAYETPAQFETAANFQENMRVTFVCTVQELGERVTQSGKHVLGVQTITEDQAQVRLVWFNQPFRKKDLAPGCRLRATGVLKSTVLNWEMVQPQIEMLLLQDEGDQQLAVSEASRPKPIYPLTEGLKQFQMRQVMRATLPELIPLATEVLPESVRERLDVDDIHTALEHIHFPLDEAACERARRRFKTQELLVLQLAISMQRASRELDTAAPQCETSGKIHARILNRIGFALTGDQLKAIEDISQDMASVRPMNRLLQGDVGSGKTVVAQYAMLLAVAHGFQSALMAPTEVLATQHAETFRKSLSASRVRVALLTGSMPRSQRAQILADAAAGEVDLMIGTQSLLSGDVRFRDLGLVIVDEQHKFGVLQRAKLRTDGAQPHYLVLSATPIPRTIAMTAFGDLDVSTIREKPPGRAAVHTYTATRNDLTSWWKFVDEKLSSGRQAYVIVPRVVDSDKDDSLSAISVFEHLRDEIFPHRRVGLLHGQLDSQAKEAALREFSSGKIEILVATTVVEVGINVPNATVMTILDANRLGLSQLHQLRGRISRGSHSGFVCAVGSVSQNGDADPTQNERLVAFQKTDDGFELAEMDLRLRGPGDLLGTSQTGMAPLKIASLVDDAPLVELARTVANELLADDPQLSDAKYEKLRRQTFARYGQSMELSDIG